MKRILAAAAAMSIVVAACGGSDEVVASVNGEDITRSQVNVLVPDTDDPSAVTDFTRYLSVVIQWEAISQAAAEEDIEPTDEEIDARLDELVAGQGEGSTLEAYLEQVQASEGGIRLFTEQLIIQDAVQADLAEEGTVTDDEVNSELANNLLDWTVVCTSHILVGSEEEAIAVQDRLAAGEDFAVVAAEVSTDVASGASGGDLGCNSPSGFVGSFAAATLEAEIDVVTEPVESEFGYHLILVNQREVATPDVVRVGLERDALASAVDAWFLGVIEAADVTVDGEIGVWVTDPSPQVLATN
jgi:foldase protein PrsA